MTESFKSLLRPSHKAYSGRPNPAISSPLYFDLALTNAGLLKNSKFQRCRGKTRGSLMSVNLVRLRWVSMNRARMQTRSSACKTKNKKEGTSKHPLQISRSHGIREILWQLKQNGIGYWRKSRPEKKKKKDFQRFSLRPASPLRSSEYLQRSPRFFYIDSSPEKSPPCHPVAA